MELLPALANASGWAVAFAIAFWVVRRVTNGDLVPRDIHQHALKEGAWWRDRALAGTSLAAAATDVAEAQADAE